MGAVLGDILFLGLGVVIGPMPISAVILLLTGQRGAARGVAYMVGWIVGLVLLVVGVALFVQGRDFSRESTPSLIESWAKLLGGVALLILAYVTWRRRPPPDAPPVLPGWLKTIQQATPAMALGAGFFFGLVSLKNLVFTAAEAATIGKAHLPFVQALIAILLFIALATAGIATPVYVAFTQQEQAQAIFERWVRWLSINNALIISLLCVLLGVRLFGDGLGGVL